MTVGELIAQLQKMHPSLPVSINDETGGTFHDNIDFLYHWQPDEENKYDDPECVVLVVNECV